MSGRRRDDVDRELVRLGYALVRSKRHRVYRHANGAQVVVAASASDWRAAHNALALARRLARG